MKHLDVFLTKVTFLCTIIYLPPKYVLQDVHNSASNYCFSSSNRRRKFAEEHLEVFFNKTIFWCTFTYLHPKYVLEDVHYSTSNLSHLPTIDDGIEGGIKEDKSTWEHKQCIYSCAFTCVYELCNQNHKMRQITSPKYRIDKKCALGRFSEFFLSFFKLLPGPETIVFF